MGSSPTLGNIFFLKNLIMNFEYRISANSFRGNYSFLNLTLCSVTFGHSTYRCRNYSRAETIRGNTVSGNLATGKNAYARTWCTKKLPDVLTVSALAVVLLI